MAKHTTDTDWIDCHALRRDADARGHGQGAAGLGVITLGVARCTQLRLIEPDGTETTPQSTAFAAQEALKVEPPDKTAAAEEAAAKAREKEEAKAAAEAARAAKAREAAKAKKEAEKQARAKAQAEAARKAREEVEAKAKADAEEKARVKAEADRKAREAAEAKALAEEEKRLKAKARREAEARAKAQADEKAKAQAKQNAEAAAKAKAAAEKKAAAQAEKKAQEAEHAAMVEAAEKARSLGDTFRRLIRETGPISLAHYMAESNARYYTSRDPLGAESDFITAPEISQMFGELIGLWIADLWVRMGSRKYIHYVELGPGRGTLAQDALRTASRYDFDPQIHFVETSPALRKLQREAFSEVHHHDDLSTLPDDAPLLIVANEFFDTLPVHQLVRSADGWHERKVGLSDDGAGDDFVFVAGEQSMDDIVPASWRSASQGTMIETSPAAVAVMSEIASRLKEQGGAALIIDYGALELRAGSTLQAIKGHEKVDPFAYPGEADLTAHVDFELLKDVAERNGADVMGLTMQGDWLRAMGIDVRHEALVRRNPAETEKLKRQYDRLVEDGQMGLLFKVLGICGRRWPFGVGFD